MVLHRRTDLHPLIAMHINPPDSTAWADDSTAVPALRDSVMLLEHADGIVDALITTTREIKSFQPNAACRALLDTVDGERTSSDVATELASQGHDRSEIFELLGLLEGERLLYNATTTALASGGPLRDRRDRFLGESALNPKAGWPTSSAHMRAQLTNATVCIIGAGGLGSWIARSLAGLGVGELVLVDPDVVEEANLSHQVVFTREDIGRPKVVALQERLTSLFPDIAIRTEQCFLRSSQEIAEIVRDADFVCTAANTPTANEVARLVSRACLPLGIAHNVGAGYSHDLGTVGLTVVPGQTACWECLQSGLADPVFDAKRVLKPAGSPVGMVPMVAGILANLVAWDVFRVLVGAPAVLANAVIELSLSTLGLDSRPVEVNPTCSCETAGALQKETTNV